MTQKLNVNLGTVNYDIHIGEGLLAEAGTYIAPVLARPRVIIVTDETVAGLYLATLTHSLETAGIKYHTIILPAGEQTKSFAHLESLLNQMLAFTPDRAITLLALGGGVIGDITGFAASILLRGVAFIQIPTTLLAQVDSSVGGKTGINTAYGKNLIGTFYQPKIVLADTSVLLTLPKRQLLAGYAEVIKYGMIKDYPFFVWLLEHGERVLTGDMAALSHGVYESCKTKAEIVMSDEREHGIRAILNFGHTLGHALEAETGYSDRLLHGEAVAIGMVLACRLSVKRGLATQENYEQLLAHLTKTGLATSPKSIVEASAIPRLVQHCYQDKKAKDGGLTFVLVKQMGKALIVNDIAREEVEQVLQECYG